VSPITAHVTVSSRNHQKCITSLDVCGASGSFTSANGNAPCLHECCCKQAPLEFAELIEANKSFFSPSLFPLQIERPPEV
jgi:hypothetical protein